MDDAMQERVEGVRRRIAAACERAGRSSDSVRLVAVSKQQPPSRIREAAACGLRILGENRVQEAAAKIPECPSGIEWHMVGHLQRNKVAVAVRLFDMIHSVDSLRLLEAIEASAREQGKHLPVCLEVNVSGEGSKFGLAPDAVESVLQAAMQLDNVEVVGLMTMPPFTPDPEKARSHFQQLCSLRDTWAERCGLPLSELSMGMTLDFEVAIEEGATLIRVGTALFGERKAAP